MISLREVNLKLEREEDCDKEPATEYVLNTIVEEEDCCKDYLVTTTTSAYSTVGIIEEENCCKDYVATTTTSNYGTVGDKNKQGLLDCLQKYGVRNMSTKRHIAT